MKRQYSNERGYILVLMIFVLALLLTVAAVAVDLGNMYRWQVRLARAARAAVTAGIGYRTLKGWSNFYSGNPQYSGSTGVNNPNTTEVKKLTTYVGDVFRENFNAGFDTLPNANGAASNLTVGTATYDNVKDEVTISATYDVPVFLVNRVFAGVMGASCSSTSCRVAAEASVNMRRANIALILDTSGSMICPQTSTDPDCACRFTNTCGTTGRKIDALKDAVLNQFLPFFNPYRDRIALVPFNMGADKDYIRIVKNVSGTPTVRSWGETQADYDEFMNRVNDLGVDNVVGGVQKGLPPLSSTNHCDALTVAYQEIKSLQLQSGESYKDLSPFTVFFTDGAPNAMIADWTNPYPSGASDRLTLTGQGQPWYHYSVEWDNAGTRYQGPSMMVNGANISLFNWSITSTTDPVTRAVTPVLYPAGATVCGDVWDQESDFTKAIDGSLTTAPKNPGCLQSLAFGISGLTGERVRLNSNDFADTFNVSGVTRTLVYSDQLYYYCPIEATDFHRKTQEGLVYTIGLGQPAPWCGDPTQDSKNSFLRKDGLLARLAFDEVTFNGNSWNEYSNATESVSYRFTPRRWVTLLDNAACRGTLNTPPTPHSWFEYGGAAKVGYQNGYSPNDLKDSDGNYRSGQYFGVTKATYLARIFQYIAKAIQVRLNS